MKSALFLCFLMIGLTGSIGASIESGSGDWLTGDFGGNHVSMHARNDSGTIEFDCAHAKFSELEVLDARHARATGEFFREHGGPARMDEVLAGDDAVFSFERKGGIVSLSIAIVNQNSSARNPVQKYTMKKNKPARLMRCM